MKVCLEQSWTVLVGDTWNWSAGVSETADEEVEQLKSLHGCTKMKDAYTAHDKYAVQ